MTRRDDVLLIEDILKHAKEAKAACSQLTFDTFKINKTIIKATLHDIQTIGEAASRISTDIQERYSEVPWAQMISIRNVIVHHYFELDHEVIWQTVTKDLPLLIKQLEKVFKELKKAKLKK